MFPEEGSNLCHLGNVGDGFRICSDNFFGIDNYIFYLENLQLRIKPTISQLLHIKFPFRIHVNKNEFI